MEDLVRAVNFDEDAIDSFVHSYVPDDTSFVEEKKWFVDLMQNMKKEGVNSAGM
jgi:hypothetical protein